MALLLGALSLSGCFFPRTASETLNEDFDLASGGELVLNGNAGNVDIVATETDTASIEATKRVFATSFFGLHSPARDLDGVEVRMSGGDDRVDIRAEPLIVPWYRWIYASTWASVDFRIEVPKDLDLDLNLAAGHVRCDGTTGNLDIDIEAGNARVRHDDYLDADESIRCTVEAGSVEIALPENSAFSVDAEVDVGSIDDGGFGLDVDRDVVGADLNGTVGESEDGLAEITISVEVGSISFDDLSDAFPPEEGEEGLVEGEEDEGEEGGSEGEETSDEGEEAEAEGEEEANEAE